MTGTTPKFCFNCGASLPEGAKFCPGCGTRIYHKPEWRKGMLSVRAGTLDDTSMLKPDVHIWTSSRQPWITIPDDVEAHEKNPS